MSGGELGHSQDQIKTPATHAGRAVESGTGHHASGTMAAGGVGNLADGEAPAGFLGQAANTFYGTPDANRSYLPSGAKGGKLPVDAAQRFIDYVWDATVLANDGRKVTMRANTMEIEKVNVGERVVRAANQADDTYVNAGAKFTKVELTTKKMRLDWEVSTESLEDGLEGAAFEDHLVRLMTSAFGNDIEDLAINGDTADTSADAGFLTIMDGFVKKIGSAGSGSHEAVNPADITNWTPEILQGLINTMPRRYRAIRTGLKFYAGTDTFSNIVANNGTAPVFGTKNAWDSAIATEEYRNRYLGGADQPIGATQVTRVLGLPVVEVPYYPSDYVDLTFPANRIWGLQRDITVNREYKAKKDTIEYTVYVRFGIAVEELDAVAFLDAKTEASPDGFKK